MHKSFLKIKHYFLFFIIYSKNKFLIAKLQNKVTEYQLINLYFII